MTTIERDFLMAVMKKSNSRVVRRVRRALGKIGVCDEVQAVPSRTHVHLVLRERENNVIVIDGVTAVKR